VQELRFERIGYAAEARSSYGVFRRLREEGTIPEGVRFLVALPLRRVRRDPSSRRRATSRSSGRVTAT
jgi:hypothetical protein